MASFESNLPTDSGAETSVELERRKKFESLSKYSPALISRVAERMGVNADNLVEGIEKNQFDGIDENAFWQNVALELLDNGNDVYRAKENESLADFIKAKNENAVPKSDVVPAGPTAAGDAAPAAPANAPVAPVMSAKDIDALVAPKKSAADMTNDELIAELMNERQEKLARGVASGDIHEASARPAAARRLSKDEIDALVAEIRSEKGIPAPGTAASASEMAAPTGPEAAATEPKAETLDASKFEATINELMNPSNRKKILEDIRKTHVVPEEIDELISLDGQQFAEVLGNDTSMIATIANFRTQVRMHKIINPNEVLSQSFGDGQEDGDSADLPEFAVNEKELEEQNRSLKERIGEKIRKTRIGGKLLSRLDSIAKTIHNMPARGRLAMAMSACILLSGCGSSANAANTAKYVDRPGVSDDAVPGGEEEASDAEKSDKEVLNEVNDASKGGEGQEATEKDAEDLGVSNYEWHESDGYKIGDYFAGTYANPNGIGPLGFDAEGHNSGLKNSKGSPLPIESLASGATKESAHNIVQASIDMAPYAAVNVFGLARQYNDFLDKGDDESAAAVKKYLPDAFIQDGRALDNMDAISSQFASNPDLLKVFAGRLDSFFEDAHGESGTVTSLDIADGTTIKDCYLRFDGSGDIYKSAMSLENVKADFRTETLQQGSERLLVWSIKTENGSTIMMTYMEKCGNYVSYDAKTDTTVITTTPVETTTTTPESTTTTTTTTEVSTTPEETTTTTTSTSETTTTTTTGETTTTTETTKVTTTESTDGTTTTTTETTTTPPGSTTTTVETTTSDGTTTTTTSSTKPETTTTTSATTTSATTTSATTTAKPKDVEGIMDAVGTDVVPLNNGELTSEPYVPETTEPVTWYTPEYEEEREQAIADATPIEEIADSAAAQQQAAEDAAAAEAQQRTDDAYESGSGSDDEVRTGDQLADLLGMVNSQLDRLNAQQSTSPTVGATPPDNARTPDFDPNAQNAAADAAGLPTDRPSITG